MHVFSILFYGYSNKIRESSKVFVCVKDVEHWAAPAYIWHRKSIFSLGLAKLEDRKRRERLNAVVQGTNHYPVCRVFYER